MRYFITLFFFPAILISSTSSYDVYLKNGSSYKNVDVKSLSTQTIINSGGRIDTIESVLISRIVLSGAPTSVSWPAAIPAPGAPTATDAYRPSQNSAPKIMYDYEYDNGAFIAVGVLSAIGSYLCFSESSDLSDAIEGVEKINSLLHTHLDTSELEDKQSTYQIFGVATAIIGVVTIVYGLTPVRVAISPDRVSLSYTF